MKFALTLSLCLTLSFIARADKPDYNNDVKVTRLFQGSKNVLGQSIIWPTNAPAEASILTVEIPPGKETGWHKHPVPIFGYVLSGTLTVKFADGKTKTLHQGDALAEAVNVLHNGTNQGSEPVRLIIFVAGQKGVPFTIKETSKEAPGLPSSSMSQ